MKNKFVKSFSSITLILALILTFGLGSCSNDEIIENVDTNDNARSTNSLYTYSQEVSRINLLYAKGDTTVWVGDSIIDQFCFQLVYPVSVNVEGKTIVVEDRYDLIDLFFQYDDTDSLDFPNLVFPIKITYPGKEAQVVTSQDSLVSLVQSCANDLIEEIDINKYVPNNVVDLFSKLSCAKIIYPIKIVDPTGGSTTVNSANDMLDQIAKYLVNSDDLESVLNDSFPVGYSLIQFPINMKMSNGRDTVANNIADVLSLGISCLNYDYTAIMKYLNTCFTLQYPVSVSANYASGKTYQTKLNSVGDFPTKFIELLRGALGQGGTWSDRITDVDFDYPLTAILADSTLVTISSQSDWDGLFANCRSVSEGCDNLSFPLSITVGGGNVNKILDKKGLVKFLTSIDLSNILTLFPVTIKEEGNDAITFNSINDIIEFMKDCNN